jgi:N4-gp56 family major capsid protein
MANTTSINSELFQNLLVQSQYALYENSIARAVSTVFDYPIGAGKVVSVPIWAGITSAKPGEGVAPAAADTNTNSKLITLAEHVVFAEVTDFLRDSAQESVIAALGNQSGLALAEGLDNELINLFDNSNGYTASGITQGVGAGGADNTVDHIMAAAAIIRSNKYTGPLFAILHPKQAYGIKKAMTATNSFQAASNVGNAILSQYFVGQIAGVTILESSLVSVDGSGDAIGAVFAPTAFGLAQRGGVTMEEQRNAAKRSTDVVLTAVAGASVLRPELVCLVTGDAEV